MGYGGDVPRATGHGACKEGGGVVNEGDDDFHKLLREPGDWGRIWHRRLWDTSTEKLFDFRLASVPEPLSE